MGLLPETSPVSLQTTTVPSCASVTRTRTGSDASPRTMLVPSHRPLLTPLPPTRVRTTAITITTTTAITITIINNSNGGHATNGPVCNGGKVGLAWAPDIPTNFIPNAKTGKTCFYYNWSSWPANTDLTAGLNFVPMYWGPGKDDEFRSNVAYSSNDYRVAMAMNEVNQAGQAQMDAYYGASLWRSMLLPLRRDRGYTLVSPSTTSADDGIPWLQTFMSILGDDEKPDIMAIHWYGKSFQDMVNYLTNFHNTFPGRKVWVTEFACTGFDGSGCNDDINYFANAADDWLNGQDWIGAYFPFGFVGDLHGVHESSRAMNQWTGEVTGVGWAFLT
ncbi:hypothetical protein FRC15_003316 [Serendipita sp. 397]|nr:hypothetical protein FRC15_003316 [Serendipita sp. 397]